MTFRNVITRHGNPTTSPMHNRHFPFIWLSSLLLAALLLIPRAKGAGFEAKLLEKENEVVAQRQGAGWQSATIGMGLLMRDRVRTGFRSRAVLALTDRTFGRMDERTFAEIGTSSIKIFEGSLYAYSRERGPGLEIETRSANGIFRGTQVVVRVTPAGKTLLSVLEGEVDLFNVHGRVILRSGEQGEAEIGKAPRKTAVIAATNLLQWALYYPGVLDPGALGLSKAEEASVAASLAAYRVGDLLGALEKYPKNYRPNSAAARLYQAGVVLAVGRVDEARRELAGVRSDAPGRRALEEMIAAVNFLERDISKTPSTASEWLARSYYLQSRDEIPGRLAKALDAARRAAALAPDFGYASVRVAELEFSQGRIEPALKELARNPRPTARNAQAHALRGFLLSAQNRIAAARAEFQTAIDLDGALGNAWLGRGLCAIRQGRDAAGRIDLQTAATVEPNRSILHSYLGKAFSEVGDNKSANKDLAWARELDPNDPTPLLYSAIQRKRENRYNEAIADLEKSVALNNNRRLYRSEFLLDQDLAIRNANLATIYRNNGMIEQSVREAVRAVNNDYASAPAHLFLANSYDVLRDPLGVQTRYEAPAFNELLVSHLLSPVGGGTLSQFVSQQEYSKLFEKDGFGFASDTTYLSTGALRQTASQYGTFGNFSYALDGYYNYRRAPFPNERFSQAGGVFTLKMQFGPRDTAFFQASVADTEGGDVTQHYNPRAYIADPKFRRFALTEDFQEKQDPGLLLLGWHHQWNPKVHTLLLLGRLADRQTTTGEGANMDVLRQGVENVAPKSFIEGVIDGSIPRDAALFRRLQAYTGIGTPYVIEENAFDMDYRSTFATYIADLEHIWKAGPNTLILGGRLQRGRIDTSVRLTVRNTSEDLVFDDPAAHQDESVEIERINFHLYDVLQVRPWLSLTGGFAYDRLRYPENYQNPPINRGTTEIERVSPKAGFILEPWRGAVLRGAFAETVSGPSFEESIRLEPTQVAGFLQAYRSLASESVAGSSGGSLITIRGLSFEQKLPTRTYLGIEFNLLEQSLDRTTGIFESLESTGQFNIQSGVLGVVPSSMGRRDSYMEEALTITLNQLVGDRWSFGGRYRYSQAQLETEFRTIDDALARVGYRDALKTLVNHTSRCSEASLRTVSLFALYNHPSGFFVNCEALWWHQDNDEFVNSIASFTDVGSGKVRANLRVKNGGLRGDDFWQFNAMAGWRFHRNRCEVSVGGLNLTSREYRLNPLNPSEELPRQRTFVVRCKLDF